MTPSKVDLLRNGSLVTGIISPAATAIHYWVGEAGQTVTMTLELVAGNISPAVYIRNVAGDPPIFTNAGSGVTALTLTVTIPTSGLYMLELSDGAYTGESGQYGLQVKISP